MEILFKELSSHDFSCVNGHLLLKRNAMHFHSLFVDPTSALLLLAGPLPPGPWGWFQPSLPFWSFTPDLLCFLECLQSCFLFDVLRPVMVFAIQIMYVYTLYYISIISQSQWSLIMKEQNHAFLPIILNQVGCLLLERETTPRGTGPSPPQPFFTFLSLYYAAQWKNGDLVSPLPVRCFWCDPSL